MGSRRTLAALLVLSAVTTLARSQGLAPEEAVRRMTVPDGLVARLVAAEPLVRQPVAIEFDDRGRLWVIQYLQYPNPAGLKRVKVDRFSRTVYDRVPEPPPRGPKGADRITILERPAESGPCRKGKDFVAGLNLATGIAFGRGGVFVLQAPYLLFYPDRDGDDVPDADPEVLLSGFGMEDAHSVANSLTWGPDGWLYGCQGSTVTANVRGIEFQQGVWRYHPVGREFELFCEGGGNCWGLDFDRHGNLVYSTNVGGFVAMHGVQGGYGWKSFGKHGPLHNPFAYGWIDHVPHTAFQGGHVTVGGIFYRGGSFPDRFRDTYIAADLLGHAVYWHEITPARSTLRSRHGGELLVANDTWFAPCDVTLGPEGAVYIADWYDRRTAHPDPDAEWDRSNGRIYRIEAAGTRTYGGGDLRRLSTRRLVELLRSRNDWFVRRARRILGERHDPTVLPALRELLDGTDDEVALQAFWALYTCGGWDERLALHALAHRNPDVRCWAVRFVGDDRKAPGAIAARLIAMARMDGDATVRSQLASTAKRLPADGALPLVSALLAREEDIGDPHIPLLLWWAVEAHALPARAAVLDLFGTPQAWKGRLVREAILPRLMRRYAAEGTAAGYSACVRLLGAAPSAPEEDVLLTSLDQGVSEQKRPSPLPTDLAELLHRRWLKNTADVTLLRLLVRQGRPEAQELACKLAADVGLAERKRLALVGVLGEVGGPGCVGALLDLVCRNDADPVRSAAAAALQRFDSPGVGKRLLEHYPRLPPTLRPRVVEVLLGRRTWRRALLRRVDEGKIRAAEVSVDQVRSVARHGDAGLDTLVRKHWGSARAATPEEKLAEVRRLNNDLRAAAGDAARGREVFHTRCATCHRLFAEGGQVGPDLTRANRKDRDYLLISIIDPSAVVRREFLSYVVQTTDGRTLTGLIAEQSPASVTLVDARNERTTLPRARIESMQESPVSLMPEDLLKDIRPEQLRDLFAYLQADRPPRAAK